MKLYYVKDAPVGHRWQGTQADAKQTGKTFASEFTGRDVPVDKPNLLKWLNAEEAVIVQQTPEPVVIDPGPLDPLQLAEMRAVEAAQAAKVVSHEKQLTADGIVQFILDDATVAQAEAVFAALGTRFKEQANASR